MNKLLPLLVLFALIAHRGFGQQSAPDYSDTMIFGEIKDSSGEHVPFANILVVGTTLGAAADATGHFKIINLKPGQHTLRAQAVGYKASIKIVDLKKGKTTKVFFTLEDDAILADEVVITASRVAQSRKEAPVIVNTISPDLFETTGSPSLAEGLNFVPGLRIEANCQNCGFSQLRLNGLDGPYTQFLVNSRPIFSSLAGVYGLEMYPSNMIERVEVVRGGGSALYGANAIGGTVNIITKDPLSNTYMAGAEYGLIDGKTADASIKFNSSMVTDDYKAGMFVYGMHRNRGEFNANPDDIWINSDGKEVKDDFSEIVRLKSTVLGFNSYYRPSERSRINFDFNLINDKRRGGNKLDEPCNIADIAEMVNHTIIGGGVSADLFSKDQKGKFSFYTSGQMVARDSYYGAEQDPSSYGKTDGLTWVSGIHYSRSFSNLFFAPAQFIGGVEDVYDNLEDRKLAYYDPFKKLFVPTTLITKQHVNTLGTFIQNEWDFGFLKVLLGARYDRATVTDDAGEHANKVYDNISPRINFLYKYNKDLQFRISYAKGFRFPQIFDEDLHIEASGARKVIHGNDANLKPETSHNITGGFDWDFNLFGKRAEFIAEGFYTRLITPFASSYETDEKTKITTATRVNAKSDAIVAGTNLEFRYTFNKTSNLQLGYTYQISEYSKPEDWGGELTTIDPVTNIETVTALQSKNMIRTPNNYGFAVFNFSPLPDFTTSITGTYTGKMFIPHLKEGFQNGTQVKTDKLITSPSFVDFGFRLAYDFHINKGTCLELSCGMKNVFNSFQNDFDAGITRDAGYIYGPKQPRTYFFGIKLGNL
ncbi:MAG: TonB-dependent receptor domain-containing protein [Bacteroidales bacterium]